MTTVSTIAPTAHTSPTVDAWNRIVNARAVYNAASPDDEAAERAHWAIVDPAEMLICTAEAKTSRELEIKLWTALAHATHYAADDRDILAQNIAALIEREETFDFAARVLINAIRDLRKLGA